MGSQHDKGRALEYAVRRIEETLLAHNPAFAGAPARIEQNKIVVVDDVRHEIDVRVVLHEGSHYETTHIIECKNWKNPVGTDEVGKLVMKRDEIGAHTASLFATSFTADAERLAQKHRIKLASVSEFRLWEIAAPLISYRIEAGDVAITYAQAGLAQMTKVSFEDSSCVVDGEALNLGQVFDSLFNSHLREATRADQRYKLPGMHSGTASFRHNPRAGSFFIEGVEVASVAVTAAYSAEIHHPTINTRLSIDGRGGFLKLDYPPGAMGFENLSLEIITKPPS